MFTSPAARHSPSPPSQQPATNFEHGLRESPSNISADNRWNQPDIRIAFLESVEKTATQMSANASQFQEQYLNLEGMTGDEIRETSRDTIHKIRNLKEVFDRELPLIKTILQNEKDIRPQNENDPPAYDQTAFSRVEIETASRKKINEIKAGLLPQMQEFQKESKSYQYDYALAILHQLQRINGALPKLPIENIPVARQKLETFKNEMAQYPSPLDERIQSTVTRIENQLLTRHGLSSIHASPAHRAG
jgi:hypothetical protein